MKQEEKEKYLIVGNKVGELEQQEKLTMTADLYDYEDLIDLADDLWSKFEKDKEYNYFSEFVEFELLEMEKRYQKRNEKPKKYFVEAWFFSKQDGERPYLFQSKWYDTVEECYEFSKLFDFVDSDIRFSIMQAEFNKDGSYGDIDVYLEDMIRDGGKTK